VRDAHNDVVVDTVTDVVEKDDVDAVKDVVDGDIDATARRIGGCIRNPRVGGGVLVLRTNVLNPHVPQPYTDRLKIRAYPNHALIG
jgi:hypothetical protein